MTFALDQPPQPAGYFEAESFQRHTAPEWISAERPTADRTIVGELETRYLEIEGGNLLLRLTKPGRLQINYARMECDVAGWDIRVPLLEAHNLPRLMARRFLDLFSKAEEDRLSDVEAQIWLSILDQVDYTSFSIDRAAPQYMEGTLIRHTPDCRVEWHDGERDKLPPRVAGALSVLEPGEVFGAFVKLGRDNNVRGIDRISKLTHS
jgi:hypothetical protein